MFPPRIEIRTLRVLSACDNHYTMETNTVMLQWKIRPVQYKISPQRFLSKILHIIYKIRNSLKDSAFTAPTLQRSGEPIQCFFTLSFLKH